MIPDLPSELWIKILSYLSPYSVHNLLGVNRLFFDFAMDELHRRFDVVEANESTLAQIQAPIVARYIRRLDIWSSCFSNLDFSNTRPLCSRGRSKLRRYSAKPCFAREILAALKAALPRLLQLEHITLVLHETLEPIFSDFLYDLCSRRAPSIRKLSINATLLQLDELLELELATLPPFPGLECLDLKLAASPDYIVGSMSADLCDNITTFIKSHRQSLCTLVLSDPAFVDVSNVFRDIGCLPNLKRLELSIPMHLSTLSRLEYLEKFLTLNASTLECLVLRCRRILHPDDITQGFIIDVLPRLSLPVLSEFDIAIYSYDRLRIPFHLPSFRRFAPNIKTLKIQSSNNYLDNDETTNLIRNLSENGVVLHSLYVQVQELSPELFLQLSSNLSDLQSLRITYARPRFDGWETPDQKMERSALCAQFQNRKFEPWSLKYLKLAQKSNCGEGHTDRLVSEAVAACIPGLEAVDVTRSCSCGCMPSRR